MLSKVILPLCLLWAVVQAIPTTVKPAATTTAASLIASNNIPKYDKGCHKITYACKKKLPYGTELLKPVSDTTRPCVKFCVKHVECENGVKIKGKGNECVHYNEEMVRKDHEQNTRNPYESPPGFPVIEGASMIDFPCQPNYYPDYRGNCREAFF